jgi:hypothetical protein
MGLFEFVKEAGEAILKGDTADAESPANVQDYLKKALGGKVKDLAVDMVGDMINLRGDAENEDVLEKAILMAGNIAGVGRVQTDELMVGGAAGGQGIGSGGGGNSEFYTIAKGDSLSKISKKYYGDGNKYMKIFEANREIIRDPDLIYPGQTIRIPPE